MVQTEALQSYVQLRADLHTHTTASDGLHTHSEMLRSAQANRIRILATTDHDMLTHAQNAFHKGLLQIFGVEISTIKGHMLLYIPKADQIERFRRNYNPTPYLYRPEDVIDLAVKYDGLTVIAHPNEKHVEGMYLPSIEELVEQLDVTTKQRVGIELHSWMSHLFPGRIRKEEEIRELNNGWGLASIAGSDAHHADDIGKFSTTFNMRELSLAEFQAAFMERRLETNTNNNGGTSDFSTILLRSVRMELRNIRTRNGRSVVEGMVRKIRQSRQ